MHNAADKRDSADSGSRRRKTSLPDSSSLSGGQSFFFFLFFLYIIIEFARPQSLVPAIGAIRPALIVAIPLGIFAFMNLSSPIYKDLSIKLLILFVALAGLAILYAKNNFWAFQFTRTLGLYVFVAVIPMCLLVTGLPRLRKLLWFWVIVHFYLALYGLTHGGKGPGSFIADENDLALALNTAIPFAYFLWASKTVGSTARMYLLVALIVMVAGVVATASRGGFVGLTVTASAIIWFSSARVRNAFLVVICSLIFYVLIPDQYKAEIESIGDTSDNTRLDRLYSWARGWEMYLDNPLLGVGVGNYPWRVSEYELASGSNYGQRRMLGGRAAHSLYFTLLPETGTAGTVVFIILAVRVFRQMRVRPTSKSSVFDKDLATLDAFKRGVAVSMVGFLVTAVFISVLYYPQFWYLVGFSVVVRRLSEARTPTELSNPQPA